MVPHHAMPTLATSYFGVFSSISSSLPGHFSLQGCCTQLFSPATALGSMFPLRRPRYFSCLSHFAEVQGQDWEQGGSHQGTRAGRYAWTSEQPQLAHK